MKILCGSACHSACSIWNRCWASLGGGLLFLTLRSSSSQRFSIGTACWPLHSVDPRLLQEVVDHPCPVGASVVILVDSHRSYLLQCRHSQRSKDLVPVLEAIQVTLYMIQGCSVVKAEGPPDHYRTSPKGHLFLDSGVNKALPQAPPDPQSAVVVVHGEA